MKKIAFFLFIIEVLFVNIILGQKKPLEFRRIVHFSPLIYTFQFKDTVFAISKNGQLLSIVLHKNNQLIKQKSKKLTLNSIKGAGWDGSHLYLSTPNGLFMYPWNKNKVKRIADSPLAMKSLMNHAVLARYQNYIIYFYKGKSKSFTFPDDTLIYAEVLSDSLAIAVGKKRLYLIHPLIHQEPLQILKEKLSLVNNLKEKIKFDKNNGIEYFSPHLGTMIKEHLLFAIGSSHNKTLMGLLNLNSDSIVYKFWVKGELLNISGMKDRFLLTTGLEVAPKQIISINYQFNPNTTHLDSFSTEFTIDLFPLNDEYYFCDMGGGGIRIFNKNYIHYFYQMGIPYENYIGQYYFKLNSNQFEGDWFVFLSSTNSIKSEHRVYQVLFVKNQIHECLEDMQNRVNLVRRMNNFRDCEEGLMEIEAAMQYATFFARDSLEKYYKLRESLYKKYRIKNSIKNGIRQTSNYVLFIALSLLLILFYWKQKKQADLLKSIPSAETLHFLLGSAFFHKLVTILLGINYAISSNNFQKLKKLQNSVKDVKNFLSQKKIYFEFKQSPKNWYQFYRRLKRYLFFLDWSINYYLMLQKIGVLRKYFLILIGYIKDILFKIREEFKIMVEQSKLDVIAHALLPAFNEVQLKYILKKINFKNKIEGEFPFRYFPDEILKFRSVFEAILENAAQACLEKKEENYKIVSVSAVSSIKELRIKIEDNGSGIPENIIQKIFAPGFSNRKDSKNHGYGLAGVKEFIEKYGTLEVKSKIGKGTSFIIVLKLEKLI